MEHVIQRLFISAGILLLGSMPAAAGWFGADFSADIYQGTAQQPVQQGRMYVSDGRVRTEMSGNDNTLIEIIDPHQGRAWLLDSRSRRYRERTVPQMDAQQAQQANPCSSMPRAHCQRLGSEQVNGRNSDKWQIRLGETTLLQWLDAEHRFPLRVVSNGTLSMEMRFLGQEQLASRRVEKWQSWSRGPQGEVRVTQWYDPQLNIAIRQQMANGQVRELRNIRLGPQPPALFTLPDGYAPATDNN
jgi:hypothetical protein